MQKQKSNDIFANLPRNWILEHKYKGHMEFKNTKSNTSLTYNNTPSNLHVSILGRGRYQPEDLVGGNSNLHDVPKKTAKYYDFTIVKAPEAKQMAYSWMLLHPNG